MSDFNRADQRRTLQPAPDASTAAAFASSWNNLREGPAYTRAQFEEWFEPLSAADLRGRRVLELGFGNGSLLYHVAACDPAELVGVELGDTFETARRNLSHIPDSLLKLVRGDLTSISLGEFDVVYCIGVIHHLQEPRRGFEALLRHTGAGGRFHGWVYAREGNALVRAIVEPIRRVASRLPWWFTKYFIALPLVTPYFLYARLVAALPSGWRGVLRRLLPLHDYSVWIAREPFWFFHHVAFDQLVTPRTAYITRAEVEEWLSAEEVEPGSAYLIFRNGNSWKFGGRRRGA